MRIINSEQKPSPSVHVIKVKHILSQCKCDSVAKQLCKIHTCLDTRGMESETGEGMGMEKKLKPSEVNSRKEI